MIAKRVLRPKAASNFGRLSAYLLRDEAAARARADKTFNYVLGYGEPAGRVGAVRTINCASIDPELAIKEILATQALNKRSRADRTYHLVVSFAPGENPGAAQLEDIEHELCAAIGLARHQRISALHTDRPHLHLHIAINKIEPGTFRCIEPYFDQRKLMAACAALELKHGLAKTNHGLSKQARPKGRPADIEAHTAETSFLTSVKDKIETKLLAALAGNAHWGAIHGLLADEGLILKQRGAGLVIADVSGQFAVKASAVNRALSMKELTSRLGPFTPSAAIPSLKQAAFTRAPVQRENTARLYAAYTLQRKEGLEARRRVAGAIAASRSDIRAAYGRRLAELRRAPLTRPGKKAMRASLRQMRGQELGALASRQREAIAQAARAYFFTWVSFLQARALDGDREALEALRASGAPGANTAAAFLSANDMSSAAAILFRDLTPIVRPNGEVTYKLADGGVLTGEPARIRVDKISHQAIFAALTLGARRFPGQALAITGTAAFKKSAAEVAAAHCPGVSFSDDALEKERRALAARQPAPTLRRR